MKVTATSHTMTGNYQSLKKAHLEHDEEKYNSNKDIRYDKKHLNTHHVHVPDFEAFYEEKYEGPIKEYNLKQKRKDRKIDDYDSYLEKKQNNKNRNKDRPHDPNRIFLLNFSNEDDNEKIKNALMKQLNLSEDEYLKMMAGAIDLSVVNFNKTYGHCLTITEHFTHINEASPHAHANLYAHGTDQFGKPYTDINDSLKELYAGTKERDGEIVQKRVPDYWKDFRAEVDTIIVESVKEKANEKLREKGVKKNLELDLYRKNSDYVGMAGEVYKEVHREADKQLEEKGLSLQEREQSLDERESALNDRETVLNAKEEELDGISQRHIERDRKFFKREVEFDEKVKFLQEQQEKMKERDKVVLQVMDDHDAFVNDSKNHASDDALVGRNLREAGKSNLKYMDSYNRMLKTSKEDYKKKHSVKDKVKDIEGFDKGM